MTEPYTYKKNYYSGICLCGHSWQSHHLSMVMRLEAFEATGEGSIPSECLRYGNNERGGLDENDKDHCFGYVDKDHPDPEEKKRWGGTKRNPFIDKVRWRIRRLILYFTCSVWWMTITNAEYRGGWGLMFNTVRCLMLGWHYRRTSKETPFTHEELVKLQKSQYKCQ